MVAERLQKILGAAGVASRRASEELIRAGRVTVDGRQANIGDVVDPRYHSIEVDGKPIPSPDAPRAYWMLNKPAGVTSTVRDRHAARTVVEMLPEEARGRLYPVGRLDESSEGLLLFTNDGEWANLVLHPRYGIEREYLVGLARPLTKPQRVGLRTGIELDEGIARLDRLEDAKPNEVGRVLDLLEPVERSARPLRWYRVVLAQGWKRQIRRMFDAAGAPVVRLVRVRMGPLRLTGLRAGEARALTRAQVLQLASSAQASTIEWAERKGSIEPSQATGSPEAADAPPRHPARPTDHGR